MAIQISGAQVKAATITPSNVDLTTAANWHFGGSQSLRWAGTPSAATDVATKAYVDSSAQGLDVKDSVKAATTGSITLSGTQSVDGVSILANDRVLVKDQGSAANGIYIASADGWTRASDFAAGSDEAGAFCFVEQGTLNRDNGFVCTNNKGSAVVGTDTLLFTQFSGAGHIDAGAGLTKSGNTLNVQVDASSIEIASDTLRIKAGGVTNAMLGGSIGLDKLVASTISGKALGTNLDNLTAGNGLAGSAYNGSSTQAFSIDLATGSGLFVNASGLKINAGGIAKTMIAANAGIEYSKLDLTNSVVAGDLAGSIPDSKLLQITSVGKVKGGAVTLSGSTLEADATGLKVKEISNPQIAVGAAIAYSKLALGNSITNTDLAGSIANSKLANNSVTVTAGNGISGGGAVALGASVTVNADCDGTSIDIVGAKIALKDSGVGFVKLGFLPYQEEATASNNQTTVDLNQTLTSGWDKFVSVTKNGLAMRNCTALGVAASDSDSYTVALNTAGGKGRITFGAGLSAGDIIGVRYVA